MEKLYSLFLQSSGVNIDTRNVEEGQMFFALKGENFNGNKFASKALEAGAMLAIVDDENYYISTDDRYILVDNTLETLQKLANYHRSTLEIPVVGLTGSNGKTTTKELITAVLSTKYKVCSTLGNLNNHIGVPLTLLSIKVSDEIAVVEMGANHIGEIHDLCLISEPTHGVITNIGHAHLEGFGSIEGVIEAKTELYRFISKAGGILFGNVDDELLQSLIPEGVTHFETISKNEIDIRTTFPVLTFTIDKSDWKTNLTGGYNLDNILIAKLIGEYFNIETTAIRKAIENYNPQNNRSQVSKIGSNTFILDHYNANPSSMMMSIQNIASSTHESKVLILGDMKELGDFAIEAHRNIIDIVSEYNWKEVYTVGDVFYNLENNMFNKFKSSEDLKKHIELNSIENSLILLKGSRGIALEKIIH